MILDAIGLQHQFAGYVMNLKEEFKKMQSRLMWFVLVLFAVGIVSIGIVGCGADEEPDEQSTTSTTPTTAGEEIVVASRPEIDYAAEKKAIQEVFTAFYQAFNDQEINDVQDTFNTSSIQFGVVFAGNEPVPVAIGWKAVKDVITGLWDNHTTANNKWGATPNLSKFWIRYKGSSLEACALGYLSYKGPYPGETHLYLVKQKGEWLIDQIDGISNQNINIFGLDNTADPRIEKFFARSSSDKEDLAE